MSGVQAVETSMVGLIVSERRCPSCMWLRCTTDGVRRCISTPGVVK